MPQLFSNISVDEKLLIEIVSFVLPPDHRMPRKYTIEFSNVWFAYNDDQTERIYNPDIDWDGTAYGPPLNQAVIVLTDKAIKTHFPMVWWPNPELRGNYVRGMYLRDITDFLVYTTAHELRHLEQWKNPKMRLLGAGFEYSDVETDADLYATLKLNSWRNLKG